MTKKKRGNPGGKRGSYTKIKPAKFPFKTTTTDGYRSYLRMYMKDRRKYIGGRN